MVSSLTLHEPSSLHALSCGADTDGAKLSASDAENMYVYIYMCVCIDIYLAVSYCMPCRFLLC